MEKNNGSDSLKVDLSKYQVKKTNKALRVIIFIGLIIWAFINLFPIYWMLTFSFKNNEEIFGGNVAGLPNELRWENYDNAIWGRNIGTKTDDAGFQMPKLVRYFINSLIVTVASIAVALIAALMATFAMTRIKWKHSNKNEACYLFNEIPKLALDNSLEYKKINDSN